MVCLLGQFILRICRIITPIQKDMSRFYETADIIHMFIRLIVIDASWKPEDLRASKGFLKRPFNLFSGQIRISSRRQEACLRHHTGSFSIYMDTTAFEHKGSDCLTGNPQCLHHLRSECIILLIILVEAIVFSSPGIEDEVTRKKPILIACFPIAIYQNRRCNISGPVIVRYHFKDVNPIQRNCMNS